MPILGAGKLRRCTLSPNPSPPKPLTSARQESISLSLTQYNKGQWDALADAGVVCSRPILDMTLERARTLVDAQGIPEMKNAFLASFGVVVLLVVLLWAGCGIGHAADEATASGIMRLTRDWAVAKDAEGGAGTGAHSTLRVDMDRPPPSDVKALGAVDLVFTRTFSPPETWQGRDAWISYDARRMASAMPYGFRLNGKTLALRLPPVSGKAAEEGIAAIDDPNKSWFVNIGSMLRHGRENTLEFRTHAGIPGINAGFWLYCRPPKEKVLLLASGDLTETEMELLRGYASAVRKVFGIDVLEEVRSFSDPASLRKFLGAVYASQRISGAVVVGSHPKPAFDFGHCLGLNPGYYQDFDATWSDSNGDGVLDEMRIDSGYGCEIWTSWIRKVPGHPELLAAFLKKTLTYLHGEMLFPRVSGALPLVSLGNAGLDHVDLFMIPRDFVWFAAHAGIMHEKGPHQRVPPETALQFYPGSLVVSVSGCHSGNMSAPRLLPPEGYIFGRSNGLVSFAGARSGGGGPEEPFRMPGLREELTRLVPHMGIYYQYMIDMSKRAPMVYTDCAQFMFGTPFVNSQRIKPAPGASVAGRVVSDSGQALACDSFYVSVVREGNCYGRVRVSPNGQYRIDCLPAGTYDIRLHLNPLETESRAIVVMPGDSKNITWNVPHLWTIQGTVLDVQGKAETTGWAEVARENKPEMFAESQIYGVRADAHGKFLIHGQEAGVVWLRGRSGADWESVPQSVSVGEASTPIDVTARLVPGEKTRSRRGRVPSVADLLDSALSQSFEFPMDEDEDPEVDIVGASVALIPATSKTVPGPLRTARGKFAGEGRTAHQIRLGLHLADGLDAEGTDIVQRYEWRITGLGKPMIVSIFFSKPHTRWEAALRAEDREQSVFWSIVPVWISENWVFVDLIATGRSQDLTFQLSGKAIRGRTRDRVRDWVPRPGMVYSVKARTGESPALVVREEPGR